MAYDPFVPGPSEPNQPGIKASDLEFRVTPQGGVAPNRLGDIGQELSSGGDSSNPVDFGLSLPLRGLGIGLQGIGTAIKGTADFIGSVPPIDYITDLGINNVTVGDVIGGFGGGILEIAAQPSNYVQENLPVFGAKDRIKSGKGLPTDVVAMLNSGYSVDEIAKYMRESGRAFANDPTVNLGAALLLDPLNLTPAIVGKLNIAKAGTRALTTGAGIAAGSALGPAGAVAGGVAGFKVGGKIAGRFTGLLDKSIGLDLGTNAKKLQAAEAALAKGEIAEIPASLKKYKVFSEFEKATFGKIRGISSNVKRGLAYTLGQAITKRLGDDGLVNFAEAAEEISGAKGRETAVGRIGLAFQNQLISAIKDSRFLNVEQKANNIVELVDADIKVAIQEFRENAIQGKSTDYVLKRLGDYARSQGKTLEERYGLGADEIKGFLQDSSNIYGSPLIDSQTGLQILDDTKNIELAKNRLANRIADIQSKAEFGPTYDPVADAVRNWDLSQEATQARMADSIEAAVQVEVNALRAGGASASSTILDYINRLAQNIEVSVADDARRTLGPRIASSRAVSIVANKMFGGATVLPDGTIIGGKYFDKAGRLTSNPKLLRELASRMALAKSAVYGYNVNRMGNVKRIFNLAATLSRGGVRNAAAYTEELSKLLGKRVTASARQQYDSIDDADKLTASRITIVRNDSLLAGKVEEWVRLYDSMNDIASGAFDVTELMNIPQNVSANIVRLISEAPDVATGISNARRYWSQAAAREFADVAEQASGVQLSRGAIPAEEVYGLLRSASDNGATISAATAQELSKIRTAWVAIGGNVDEFDDLVRSLESDGYRVGLGPEGNTIKTPIVLGRLKQGDKAIPEIAAQNRPFVDITSDFVDGLPNLGVEGAYHVGKGRAAIQSLMAPISQSTIGNAAFQRLTLVLGERFSVDEISAFYRKVSEFAVERRIGMRGLDPADYKKIMDDILKEKGQSLDARMRSMQDIGLRPIDLGVAMNKALAGEFKQVGYSQYITGKAKTLPVVGQKIGMIAENYYPTVKYKYSPLFFMQELIESPFFAELRGIDKAAIEKKLSDAGFTAQELRSAWGDRSAALAQQIHDQAFFTTMVGSRNGVPSTLRQNIRLRDVFFEGRSDILETRSGITGKIDKIIEPKWTKAAEFKESYRDIMAIKEMSGEFQNWIRTNRPAEYLALAERYGDDALDQLLGWYTQYKRMQAFKFGGSAIDGMKKPGFGFAVNPSVDALNDVINTVYGVEKAYTPEAFGQLIAEGVRPEVVASVLRAKIVNVAKDGGFDVTRLNDALNRLELTSSYLAREYKYVTGGFDEAKYAYQSAMTDFIQETRALSAQYALSEVNKTIVLELVDNFFPGLGTAEEGARIIEALGNAKAYGAELNILADIIEQVRVRANAIDVTPATRAQIKAVVANLVSGESTLAKSTRSVQKILADSSELLFEKHAGEEAAFQAAKYSYQTAAEAMDRVNYFNKNRGWLERGLNHQFLGLYPLSYMFGKVLPELTRFMFYKPFGKTAPGAGYSAYIKMKEYWDRNQPGPEYQDIAEQPEYLFLLAQLIPGHPEDITVVIPGWLRRAISTVSRQGYDQYGVEDVMAEPLRPFTTSGIFGTGQMLLNSIAELTTPERLQQKPFELDQAPNEFRR